MIALLAGLVLLVPFVFWLLATYSGLVSLRNRRESAWNEVDALLERRNERVANLIEMVERRAGSGFPAVRHVTELRARAVGARGRQEKSETEGALTEGLKRLLTMAERQPGLRCDQGFLALQEEFAEIEDAIQNARRRFNAVVRDLNTRCERFPNRVIAPAFGFRRGPYFEMVSPAVRATPRVRLEA
jgi:LemA protein